MKSVAEQLAVSATERESQFYLRQLSIVYYFWKREVIRFFMVILFGIFFVGSVMLSWEWMLWQRQWSTSMVIEEEIFRQ